MQLKRAAKAVQQIHRSKEILDCRRETPDWLQVTARYLGVVNDFPLIIRTETGPIQFLEPSDVPTFWQIFFQHVYDVHPSDRLIIDAGANIGCFTLFALRRNPKVHVIALEPASDSFTRIEATLQAHQLSDRATLLRAALGGGTGTTTIQTTPGTQFRQTGRGGEPTSMVGLADLIDRFGDIDLLKLDVEGGEWDAIQAAPPEALSRIGRISMEFHPGYDIDALLAKLIACGFRLNHREDHCGGYGLVHLTR